ncbi:MAG: hypothetical protein JOY79_01170, partial [Acidobacteriaceae bacterium]|nr:hypothetical protein [Acidobacteriaceae bacterium]
MIPLRALTYLALTIVFIPLVVHAGGPQLIGNGVVGTEGQAIVWDPTAMPIIYVTDGGSLGPLTNTQANQRVQQAFDKWAAVSSADISFASGGAITGVPGNDVRTVADLNQVAADCMNGLETAIVYDADGSLFLDLYSDPSVVGFAGVCAVTSGGYILSGVVALNGSFANLGDEFDAAMMHEFGHLIGLDH